jgi:hypothetical protein
METNLFVGVNEVNKFVRKMTVALVVVIVGFGAFQIISYSATDPAPVVSARSLNDIGGHWANEAIQSALLKGYVDGYEDGSFRPDQSVTRAEFVKMTVTALKLSVSGKVEGADWYIPFANAAVSAGLHKWTDFNYGDWNTPMTRTEMSRVAARAIGEVNEDDKKWLYLATNKGLVQGMDDSGALGEEQPTNRSQSVTMIERILTIRGGGTLPVDKYAVSRAEILWHKTNIFTVMPKVFGGEMYPGGTLWDPNNLRIDTPDGLWSGELDALIAIDLEDPNDPNRSLLPPMSELKWYKSVRFPNQMEEIMPAYLLYFKSHVNYNNDPILFPFDKLLHGMLGIEDWDPSRAYDVLSGQTGIYQKSFTDTPAVLVPKKLKTSGNIMIDIRDPIIAPNRNHSKNILWVKTQEMIE